MKYMGSKRSMLENGLGVLLREEGRTKRRIVDLFAGSASVAWFGAQHLDVPVKAVDLQQYSVWLARSVISRTASLDASSIERQWLIPSIAAARASKCWKLAKATDEAPGNIGAWANASRELCEDYRGSGVIWRSYGGYYFSPRQAVMLDFLRRRLPSRGPVRWVCEAALLSAAIQCAAAPGHTAQPFSTSRTAGPYLRECWQRDPAIYARRAIQDLSPRFAKRQGVASVGDAVSVSAHLNDDDLVFVDPPYSGVHYSRFYHVLETLARGTCGPVEGFGRYPPSTERPSSAFSIKTKALEALTRLFSSLSQRGCTTIVTFPNHVCSNGLAGEAVLDIADEYFRIDKKKVKTRFSTLGGNGRNRTARQMRGELILLLRPK